MTTRRHLPEFVVKVCGVTTVEDAQAALDAGANALGFNFYPPSSRYLTFDAAARIISALSGDYLAVGIFVDPSDQELTGASEFLQVAQIHGMNKRSFPPLRLGFWRAIPAGERPNPDPNVQAYLLDSPATALGGSGQTFDWNVAAAFPCRSIIAGGLDSSNVGEAIRVANPWGVDSCSRLESLPGRKDHHRMVDFVEKALEAFHARQAVEL